MPIENGAKAEEVARQWVLKMGFTKCQVVRAMALKSGFTMFVVYAHTEVTIDPDTITVEANADMAAMTLDETATFIAQNIGREIVVVGACIGTDAHTVGIDAIMNMKGFHGHYGLERYAGFSTYNLGAQVSAEDLVDRAVAVSADAILVSRSVTQKDAHIRALREFINHLEIRKLRDRFILVAGGPRTSYRLARELGFDAGFSVGSHAGHVATFLAQQLAARFVTVDN